jgi:hypothetical protein
MSVSDKAEGVMLRQIDLQRIVGFAVVAVIIVLPVLLHLYLPLIDIPNHIARYHIAAMDGGPLADYYSYDFSLVPNSAADLAFLMLNGSMEPVRFAQLAMAFYMVLLLASGMVLFRVVWGHWSLWSLAVAIVVYNGNFFWGFQNFVLSMPIAFLGLALWLGTEGRPSWQRLAVLVPAAAFIYVLHFFAFAFLAFAAFGREVQRLLEARGHRGAQLRQGSLMALPFLLPALWLLIDLATSPPSPSGSLTMMGGARDYVRLLLSITLGPVPAMGPSMTILGLLALACLALLLAFCLACLLFPDRLPKDWARLSLAPVMIGPLVAVTVAAALAPTHLNGAMVTHVRLPFAVFVMLIAGSRWEGLSRRGAATVGLIVLTLVGARALAFERIAARHEAEMRLLSDTLARVPPGARVLPVSQGDLPLLMWHVDAYSVSQRDAFVPDLFQGFHNFEIRPDWRSYSVPVLEGPVPLEGAIGALRADPDWTTGRWSFLQDWNRKFTYVLLIGPVGGAEDALPPGLFHPVSHAGRFTLYETLN